MTEPRLSDEPEVLEAALDRLIAVAGASRTRQAQLEHALQSRVVVEQAKGVLAERLRMTPDEAFERLRIGSRRSRLNIHEVARRVVASAERG